MHASWKGDFQGNENETWKVLFSRVLSESFVSPCFFLCGGKPRRSMSPCLESRLTATVSRYDRLASNDAAFYSVILENFIRRFAGECESQSGRLSRQSYCTISVERIVVTPAVRIIPCRENDTSWEGLREQGLN